jgi:O-acetyl-ADP-ribose deacetylase (regulator of RNase III)
MVHYERGNLLDAPINYICHQVNCQGVMGAGIAKQIRERWPRVYTEYSNWYASCEDMLGLIQTVHIDGGPSVINMAAQRFYGNRGRFTSYDAFWNCLNEIRREIPKGSKIGFPWGIGCGFGGAKWQVISTMICEVLGHDYEVYIYQL